MRQHQHDAGKTSTCHCHDLDWKIRDCFRLLIAASDQSSRAAAPRGAAAWARGRRLGAAPIAYMRAAIAAPGPIYIAACPRALPLRLAVLIRVGALARAWLGCSPPRPPETRWAPAVRARGHSRAAPVFLRRTQSSRAGRPAAGDSRRPGTVRRHGRRQRWNDDLLRA